MRYSIRVYKEYFNFSSAHFLIFENGSREPLHGHNYRVAIKGDMPELNADMVFDFLDIKPIVKEVCDSLDHKMMIPLEHAELKVEQREKTTWLTTPEGETLNFPSKDCLLLPIENTSAERLAIYINAEIRRLVRERFQFEFERFETEVEETPGQSAIYVYQAPRESM